MVRAFNNLLDNAAQYAEQNNPIIGVTTQLTRNKISIIVEDNGIGIQPEDKEKIFQPFTRLDKNRKRKKDNLDGYGMGLAIVKRILQRHKGDVYCHTSKLGGLKIILKQPVK